MTNKTWQEEYKEQFGLCDQDGTCNCKKELNFISALIQKERTDERAKVYEEVSKDLENSPWAIAYAEMIRAKTIKALTEKIKILREGEVGNDFNAGYGLAKLEILEVIENLK
jgi:hypothetical protein